MLSVFSEGMIIFGTLAFIPTHLHFQRGVELSTAGLALVAYAAGGVLFAIFAGRIVKALGEVRLARGGAFEILHPKRELVHQQVGGFAESDQRSATGHELA